MAQAHTSPKRLAQQVASTIRKLMEWKGLSSRKLAEKSGKIGARAIDKTLTEESSPSLDTLCEISNGLEVAPWQLLVPGRAAARGMIDPHELDKIVVAYLLDPTIRPAMSTMADAVMLKDQQRPTP